MLEKNNELRAEDEAAELCWLNGREKTKGVINERKKLFLFGLKNIFFGGLPFKPKYKFFQCTIWWIQAGIKIR